MQIWINLVHQTDLVVSGVKKSKNFKRTRTFKNNVNWTFEGSFYFLRKQFQCLFALFCVTLFFASKYRFKVVVKAVFSITFFFSKFFDLSKEWQKMRDTTTQVWRQLVRYQKVRNRGTLVSKSEPWRPKFCFFHKKCPLYVWSLIQY